MDKIDKYLGDSCGMTHGKKKRKRKGEGANEAYQYTKDNAVQYIDNLFNDFGMLKKMVKSSKMEMAWKKFITVVNLEVAKMPEE